MKTKWSPFKPFSVESSAVDAPFLVRAKDHPETSVQFNQFGQVISCATGYLLGWLPEEMAEIPSAEAKGETAGKATGEPGDS